MAHVIELDGLEADGEPDNHRCPKTGSSLSRPTQAGKSVKHEMAALIPRLMRYARALTRDAAAADDLVQDCLASALRKSHLWEPGSDLRAWLFTILHNQYVNRLRRDARDLAKINLQRSYRISTVLPDQHIKLELRDVERALLKLPDDQQSLILLVGLEGMRYEDAAVVANLPLGTVRSRIARGRARLRSLTGRSPPDLFEGADFKEALQ